MWNWIMRIWLIVSVVSMFYLIYQVNLGKRLTWREVGFFSLGLFIAGMPTIYVLNW